MNLRAQRKIQIPAGKSPRHEKWRLLTDERQKISISQSQIWELHIEINAIGALFRNMQTSDMSSAEYYGVSLCLLRMGRRLVTDFIERSQPIS